MSGMAGVITAADGTTATLEIPAADPITATIPSNLATIAVAGVQAIVEWQNPADPDAQGSWIITQAGGVPGVIPREGLDPAVQSDIATGVQASDKADTARAAADAAQQVADQAQSAASTAQSAATAAQSRADAAKQAADAAAATAGTSSQQAQDAAAAASTAQQIANAAKANAATAQSAADAAQQSADGAASAAASAQSSANANASDLASFTTTVNAKFSDVQSQIDGSITTWFYAVPPTTGNAPASSWTTTALKNAHLGDLYYDTSTGYAYRWQVVSNVYGWSRITDVDVTKALADAAKAQDTADGKRRVFTTPPAPPYDVGDLWAGGPSGELMRCKVAKSSAQSYAAGDWEKASKYTDDTAAAAANAAAVAAQGAADKAKAQADRLLATAPQLISDPTFATNGDGLGTAAPVTPTAPYPSSNALQLTQRDHVAPLYNKLPAGTTLQFDFDWMADPAVATNGMGVGLAVTDAAGVTAWNPYIQIPLATIPSTMSWTHASKTVTFSNALNSRVWLTTFRAPSTNGTPSGWYIANLSVKNITEAKAAADAASAAQATADTAKANAATAQAAANAAQSTADQAKAAAAAAQAAADAAAAKAGTAQASADGKNVVKHSTAPATGTSGTPGDMWFQHQTDPNDPGSLKMPVLAWWMWSGTEWASQQLTGAVLTALDAGTITVGALSGIAIYSPGVGLTPRTQIVGSTIQVIRADDEGNEVVTVQLGGADGDQMMITDTNGNPLGGFDGSGNGLAQTFSADQINLNGNNLIDWITSLPQGVVARQRLGSSASTNSFQFGSTDYGILELDFQGTANHTYRVVFDGLLFITQGTASLKLWATSGAAPAAPTFSNATQFQQVNVQNYRGSQSAVAAHIEGYITVPSSPLFTTYNVLLSGIHQDSGGYGRVTSGDTYQSNMVIEDLGWYPNYGDGALNNGGGTPYSGSSSAPGATTPVRTYTKTWSMAAWRAWRGSGTVTDYLQQGYYGGYQRYSVGLFNGDPSAAMTGYKSISGMWLYLKNASWYASSGGKVRLGHYDSTSLPSSPQTSGGGAVEFSMSPGQGLWVGLPSGWWSGLANGTIRGFTLGEGAGTGGTYYGKFDASKCALKATYSK